MLKKIALAAFCVALGLASAQAKKVVVIEDELSRIDDLWLDKLTERWDYAPLLAKAPKTCSAFKGLLAAGYYPGWAGGQSGLCGADQSGAFYYGFAVAKAGGVLEVGVVTPGGAVCVGTGYRRSRGPDGTAPWIGAVALACSDKRVATGEFHQGETFISDGRGRFLDGPGFTFTSFGISGVFPSKIKQPDAEK